MLMVCVKLGERKRRMTKCFVDPSERNTFMWQEEVMMFLISWKGLSFSQKLALICQVALSEEQ